MVTYKLYLIRHGMTKGNLEGRFVGRTDLPLCEEGIAELKKLQEEYEYPDVQKVYSSPMARCVETADILYPNRLLQRVDNLREYDFGVFEGQLAKDLAGTKAECPPPRKAPNPSPTLPSGWHWGSRRF